MPAVPAAPARFTALIATADALLSGTLGGPLTPAGRDRGAAYALRIALEAVVDAALTAREAGLRRVSMRAKILCLRHYAGADVAHRVSALWNALSAGCKYHHHELGPSHAQVRAWRKTVGALATELAAPGASADAHTASAD
ncbi:hypothetical protein GCM10009535_50520 [Streptomyces thermocarboxydovorans]|uniref:Four helix bundle protein n=1 Tax=Streptomyces thermocarboxydovorans TaxID=59298 RepID=A0ABP3SUM0_9ACTN